ncbi:UNVERIFIED_CONTAM: GDSL esterase/lipase [Sesamum calycinum]|uniref:GDSL esterase/lipase n=1 Tax=Sesamum calycinum TaxID=2727403 RepID=A0AAW2JEX2_9LAMI
MGLRRCISAAFLVFMVSSVVVVHGDPLVPALLLFGDSVVDVGNNNNLQTLVKANFLPYGRDFNTHKPTGRFSNGKLATDFTAEYLGFTSYQPAYLSQEARGRNILTGVNFASAASGHCSLYQDPVYARDLSDSPVQMDYLYYRIGNPTNQRSPNA